MHLLAGAIVFLAVLAHVSVVPFVAVGAFPVVPFVAVLLIL